MKEKINLFVWGIHDIRMLKSVCRELYDKGKLEYCVCMPMGTRCDNSYNDDIFHVIPSFSLDENTIELLKENEYPPLDWDIITKMLPFESKAIELGIRRTNVPIVEYTREKQRYYRELRRILYIFRKYQINSFFATAVPHYQDAYIAYSLSKIYNLKIRFFVPCTIKDRRLIANDIDTIGCDIFETYDRLLGENTTKKIKSSDLMEYFNTQTLGIEELKQIKNPGQDGETKKIKRMHTDHYWGVWKKSHQLVWNPLTRYVKRINELQNKKLECCWKKKKLFLDNLREEHALVHFFYKYYRLSLDKYNNRAELPLYDKPFILFALQFVPEATTCPQAGVFSSQYTSIQLLAYEAKKYGIDIYVKEHGHLSMRNKHFYDEIGMIKNVKFIKSSVSTYELIEKCIAVASQTGSCLMEAVMQNKPALAFGKGYLWKGLPGLFEILDSAHLNNILRNIMNQKVQISNESIYKYFVAIDEKTVIYKAYRNNSNAERAINKEILKNIFIGFTNGE